jgi:hypothetical protein
VQAESNRITGSGLGSRRKVLPWAACAVPTGVLAIAGTHQISAAYAAPVDGWADGYPDSGFEPDTSNHSYCWADSFTWQQAREASDAAMRNLDRQTAMTQSKVDCSSLTDAVWQRTTDSGVDGSYTCQAFNSAGECERAAVRINFNNMNSNNDWKQTSCHELGHSVGLTHVSTDCMGTSSNNLVYSTHHVNHINCKCDNP